MIDAGNNPSKSSNEYLESIRQQLGLGHSDRATKRTHKKELGKNDFIKLMSVQLQHQDPTSPLKNEEMAAQLAQFSSLEQMQNVNTTLEKMSRETRSRDNLMASQFIGKEIVTDSSRFEIDEDRRADLKFDLQGDVAKGTLAILDANDKVIREVTFGALKKGTNSIKWDGRDKVGTEADVGAYSFRITAYDKNDTPVKAEMGTKGLVSGVEFENGQPVLLVNNKRLPLNEISKIQDPLVSRMVEAAAGAKTNEPKNEKAAEKQSEAKSVAPPAPPKAPSNAAAAPKPSIQDMESNELKEALKIAQDNAKKQMTSNANSSATINPQEGLEGMKLFDPTGIGI